MESVDSYGRLFVESIKANLEQENEENVDTTTVTDASIISVESEPSEEHEQEEETVPEPDLTHER
jgi:hypothetical protein